jgi:hypothetical protein
MQFKPFELHFKFLYSKYEIFLHNWILHFLRIPLISNLNFFGLAENFIWILQVFAYFEIYLDLFETGVATWLILIGRYQFGRIKHLDRWILNGLGGSDSLIPLQLRSNLRCLI